MTGLPILAFLIQKKRKNTEFGFEDGDTFQNKCQTAFSCYVGIFTGDYQFSFKMQVSKNT